MASRYENNNKRKLKDGRTVYRSKIYPNIPKKDKDKMEKKIRTSIN